jgi:hypothetical protein
MTMFDERERAFENLFAHEEDLRFFALARRNQLFARWAAEQMGLRGADYHAYVRSFTQGAVRREPDETLIAHVREDFIGSGVEASEQSIRRALTQAAAEAARQVRSEVRDEVA